MTQKVDLLPEEYSFNRIVRMRVVLWFLIILCSGLLTLLLGEYLNTKAQALEDSIVPLREQVASLQGWGERVVPLATQLGVALERRVVVNELLAEPSWSELLSDVAGATGGRLWLTEFEIKKETTTTEQEQEAFQEVVGELFGTQPTEIEHVTTVIVIKGVAPSNFDVIFFITRLSKSSFLSELRLEVSRMPSLTEDYAAVEFEIRGVVQ